MSNSKEQVNSPSHYNRGGIETKDKMQRIYGSLRTADFFELSAFKYRDRAGYKVSEGETLEDAIIRDIKKAMKCEELAEQLRSKHPNAKPVEPHDWSKKETIGPASDAVREMIRKVHNIPQDRTHETD